MRKIISLSSVVAGAATLTVSASLLFTAHAQPAAGALSIQAPQGLMLRVLPEASAEITPAQRNQLNVLHASRGIGAISVARLSPQTLMATGVGQSVQLNLAPNVSFAARALAVEKLEGGGMLWRGEVASALSQMPPGLATFVVNGSQITGSIRTPNGDLYQVRPLADGGTAIIKFDYATAPEDEPADFAKPTGPRMMLRPQAMTPGANISAGARPATTADTTRLNPAIAARLSPAVASQLNLAARYRCLPCIYTPTTPRIDVLVAYTASAQAAAGDINGLINLAVAETNDSFTNSGVKAQLHLVGTMPVTYNDSSKSFGQMVAELAGTSDGFVDNVHAQRDALHADVVVMIINNTAYCGMADDIGATAATAFVVVHYSCATGYYSFGHEIGHLLAARHDVADDATPTPFAYGHGFRHDVPSGGWRTIMSYRCPDGGCDPRLQYWSTPSVIHNGLAMGTAATENNAAVWNARAATVAGFR